MSEVKRFHKKEAAKILAELRSKTYDEKLMAYRRQLLNHDKNTDNVNGQNSRDLQGRSGQANWQCQWPYPYMSNAAFPAYNTIPIGYRWSPNPQYNWLPNSTPYVPDAVANPFLQGQTFPGLEYQPINFPWSMTPQQQAYVDPSQSHSRRSRTQYTDEQRAILEESFLHGSKYPSPGERMRLESKTGVSKDKISVWFQNRRATEKRRKEQDGGSKESTTTDSELETEDEKQLSVCDETPGEDSEIEDASNGFKATYLPVDIATNTHNIENTQSQEGDTTQALNRYCQSRMEYTANHPYNPTSEQLNPTNQRKNIPRLGYQNKEAFNNNPTNIPSYTSIRHTQQTLFANVDKRTPNEILYPERNISKTQNHTNIHVTHCNSISKNECTEKTTSITPSNTYHSETEGVQILQSNPHSIIKGQHLNGVSTNMSTMIPPPVSNGTNAEKSITSLHPKNQVTSKDDKQLDLVGQSNIPRNVIKQPYPDEEKNTVDSNKPYNRKKIDGTENQRDNLIGDVNVPNLLGKRKKPSFMILSLPGGMIAVESTERCLEEITESQNLPNSSKHTNTPTQITLSHSEDTLTLFHGENENSMTQPVQLKTSTHNRNPRKRTVSETETDMDRKPDVIVTDGRSYNDNVMYESKKDIVLAEGSKRSECGFDDFSFEGKKD